jgi:hypothetical protein
LRIFFERTKWLASVWFNIVSKMFNKTPNDMIDMSNWSLHFNLLASLDTHLNIKSIRSSLNASFFDVNSLLWVRFKRTSSVCLMHAVNTPLLYLNPDSSSVCSCFCTSSNCLKNKPNELEWNEN